MVLGNSFGNNKGKVYIKNKENIDSIFASRAYDFEVWFSANYDILSKEIKAKGCYNEDVFHDCFFKVRDSVLYSSIDIVCFKSYFYRSYFTNNINEKVQNAKKTSLNDGDNDLYHLPVEEDTRKVNRYFVQKTLFEYFDKYLSPKESEIMKIYCVSGSTMIDIAKTLNVGYYVIQESIAKAKKKLADKKELKNINCI